MTPHRRATWFLAAAVLLGPAGGCVLHEKEVPRAPEMTFVATEDEPIETRPTMATGATFAGPVAPEKGNEERMANDRLVRLTSAANNLRVRFDNLAATVALVPELVDAAGRTNLDRLRALLSDIDGGLLRLKIARDESAGAIATEVEGLLAETDRKLADFSAELAQRREQARK